jgi:AraC-like DNA-binding protein
MSQSPQSDAGAIDMQCGLVLPVRATSLAMLGRYEYSRHGNTEAMDKAFPAHVINVTTAGLWEFHGRTGRSAVFAGVVTLGMCGERYSCAHSDLHSNSNLILGLSDAAIDRDVAPIFDAQVLTLPSVIPMLQRTLASESDAEFESRAFEVFDWVSKASVGTACVTKGSSLRMQRVKRFIEQHAFEDISLADISAIVGLNPFVCLRQFKQATGITPHAYLLDCRAKEARRLLRASNISVEEVANRTGFYDHAYFSRFFKRSTGLTPTEYRKRSAG